MPTENPYRPGSPEWYAAQPDSYWYGSGTPLADPGTNAVAAGNPAMQAYLRSGLSATNPIFTRTNGLARGNGPLGNPPTATPAPSTGNPISRGADTLPTPTPAPTNTTIPTTTLPLVPATTPAPSPGFAATAADVPARTNFNADDPNNPLLALIPQDGNRFGAAGRWMPFDADPGGGFGQFDASQYTDPRYWEQYTVAGSEGDGGRVQWRPRAEVQARLRGRVQVHDLNTGGQGQVIDPAKVEYDPEFGLVTTPDNILPNYSRTLRNNLLIAAMMAPAAFGVAGAMGATGATGATGTAGATGVAGTTTGSGLGLGATGSAGVGLGATGSASASLGSGFNWWNAARLGAAGISALGAIPGDSTVIIENEDPNGPGAKSSPAGVAAQRNVQRYANDPLLSQIFKP